MRLAMQDNKQFFLDLMDDANSANASFYPVDPRGLPTFDNPIGPDPPPPITVDAAMLKQRIEVMRTLAGNTDGIAVVNSNDLDGGMKRISDDLTSYYLLGYYSTNAKLDGRFRSLKVKVKEPGVEVRARRGYRAATAAEVTAARRAADAPVPEATRAVTAAIDRLGRVTAGRPVSHQRRDDCRPQAYSCGWRASCSPRRDAPMTSPSGRSPTSTPRAGTTSVTTRVTLKPGERTFLTSMTLPAATSGELSIRARLTAAEGGGIPLSDLLRIEAASAGVQPLSFGAASRRAIASCPRPTCGSAEPSGCGWSCRSTARSSPARGACSTGRDSPCRCP